MENVRIYWKRVNEWQSLDETGRIRLVQVELAYKEYDHTGRLVCTGTEDFSADRMRSLDMARVFAWDGKRRMKGGQRWFDEVAFVRFDRNRRKAFRHLMQALHPEAEAIRIETI